MVDTMGFEEVSQVLYSVANALSRLAGAEIGLPSLLAWLGITLVFIVAVYYVFVGVAKTVKLLLNMRAKYLGIFTLALGLALIAIAILLP